jgi:chorismate-pyruvate lyase
MTGPGRSPPDGADAVGRAERLVALFCPHVASFGTITSLDAGELPAVDRQLLDHRSHMTVTMERHHGCRLDVRVVAEQKAAEGGATRYAREILLVRPDGQVVQYGIVRIDLAAVDPATAAAIRRATAPLGRILIEAGLLCDVQRVSCLRIEPGPHLGGIVGERGPLSGRVAEILVGGQPAIELLEVVVPS